MTANPRIAIDAMGGDIGPSVMIEGAALARRRDRDLRFDLYGDEDRIAAELKRYEKLSRVSVIHHCPDVIGSEEKPSQAIRRSKGTSMGEAVRAVKDGTAHAAVSGGNTGALMAISKLALRTMEGIDRPALSALLPTVRDDDLVMLDLGANTECDAQNLVQFAVMGAAYARTVMENQRPRVRLLNIGTEDLKGTDELKDAAQLLRDADYLPFDFQGFTEGDKLARGDVDVVVTDGFSGNIALKTAEGTARFVTDLLRNAFKSSLRSRMGFLISKPAMRLLKVHLDPNNHNGAVFLGLNGIVVKSHGGASAKGVANALTVAGSMVRNDITKKIHDDLENFRSHTLDKLNEAAK
ncbi:phosphate acyltransferase PlsX [Sphingomicrobium arenosum]|uniref:phosphate acyltransferase PlsX n=1 Tax=Sphingomicrobium arenosum TaxID=2233861 RepID=UPI002240FC22|nr:phosphate acyltransferase PlsX [Sphingomicrobium arenosum]